MTRANDLRLMFIYEGEATMANKPGTQLDIKFCPVCKGDLRSVSEFTHTYECPKCKNRF